jgi:hypothetical protein
VPTQLRIYTIQDGKLPEFVGAWKGGVMPLRRAHGFTVEGAWVVEEESLFVWILSREGTGWEEAEASYYGSEERKALDPDPAQWIERADTRFISPVIGRG